MKFSALVSVLFILLDLTLRAEQAPEGLLIVQEPSTTFTEAIEYRSFHQDNALFATLVTSKGENKKMKAAAVIAVCRHHVKFRKNRFEFAERRAPHPRNREYGHRDSHNWRSHLSN